MYLGNGSGVLLVLICLIGKMNQCCLHKSKVVHEGEREIRPKWPAIYTFL
jgi:hypothetical protein